MTLLTNSNRSHEGLHDGFSQKFMKSSNTRLLFNLIRNRMPISRAALAKETGLSPTTVSVLVDEMIQGQWIREVGIGDLPERGRRPIMLEINPSKGFVIVINIFSGGYKCTLCDLCLNVTGSVRIRQRTYTSSDVCVTINGLLKSRRIAKYRLLGIHIIFPGLFDAATGQLRSSTVIPQEELLFTDLVNVLKDRFRTSIVRISNNGGVIAYSEFIDPEAKAQVSLLSINIDEGISGGMVLGEDRSGTCISLPLEIGHIIVDKNGLPCRCGNHGCLETISSTSALYRSLNEKTHINLIYRDSFGHEENQTAMETVAKYFQASDSTVVAVLEDYVYTLCSGLISVINLCNINHIHIGGSISSLGPGFVELIYKTINERFSPLNTTMKVSLVLSPNDFEKNLRAAALMTLDEIFSL